MKPSVQDLSKFSLPVGFRGRNAITCHLWWLVQDTIFRWSPQFAYSFRRMLLRSFGARIGQGVIIRPSTRITYPWKIDIGDYAWVGDRAELYSLGKITIGPNAVISQNCYLCTGSHDMMQIDFPIYEKPITIESEAWLCAGVFVMPGVTVGRGAVVGATSLVTHDLPAMIIAKGSPAKIVGERITNNKKSPPA